MIRNPIHSLVLFFVLTLVGGCASTDSHNNNNPFNVSQSALKAEQARVFSRVKQPLSVNIAPLSPEVLAAHPEMSSLPGQWWGVYDYDGMAIIVTIEEINLDKVKFYYCWDGPRASCNQVFGHIVGKGKLAATLRNGTILTLTLSRIGMRDAVDVFFKRSTEDVFLTATLIKAEN